MSALTKKQYWLLLVPLGVVLLCEAFAIYTYNFPGGLIGGMILVAIFHALFAPRYRYFGFAIFLGTLAGFLTLVYFGCPSLPEFICRSTRALAWAEESMYLAFLSLALVLTVFVIKSA